MSIKRVAIGLIGPVLDAGRGPERWERWRPTVCLGQQEDLIIDRFELLYQAKFTKLKDVLVQDLAAVSPETQVRAHPIEMKDAWDFEDVYGALHDFCRGYTFNPDSEEYLVHITTGSHVAQICMFLLTESRHLPGKLIQTAPPSNRRPKENDPGEYRIIDLDLSRYDRLSSRFAKEHHESTSFLKSGIQTRNKRFNALIDQIEKVVVNSKAPVLLTGPTGAGKSRLATRIYELKKTRRQISGPFVEVNCATLKGDSAMSALFGHVKGSFTGALQDRQGLLRAADGGLLFLDEVGELGLDEQAMLLRALEEKRFLPVGSDKEVKSDFQLIAGTNCELLGAVAAGRFRDDLLARINLWTFQLPSLQERPEDLEPNLQYELEQFAQRNGTNVTFSKEAREKFVQFATSPEATWAGNFRDLNGAVMRMATLAAGGRITLAIVDEEIVRLKSQWKPRETDDAAALITNCLGQAVEKIDIFERAQLAEVIRVCQRARNLSEAGRMLFTVSRTKKKSSNDADRLRKYLARFDLNWESVRATNS